MKLLARLKAERTKLGTKGVASKYNYSEHSIRRILSTGKLPKRIREAYKKKRIKTNNRRRKQSDILGKGGKNTTRSRGKRLYTEAEVRAAEERAAEKERKHQETIKKQLRKKRREAARKGAKTREKRLGQLPLSERIENLYRLKRPLKDLDQRLKRLAKQYNTSVKTLYTMYHSPGFKKDYGTPGFEEHAA